jgi:hypothetical protein
VAQYHDVAAAAAFDCAVLYEQHGVCDDLVYDITATADCSTLYRVCCSSWQASQFET